ncbi:unnamed protein product [Macrosiphum euphorbiae]|uniref:DDE-1 domain-containing protein n=1 Tax=Macrosiphum euphorbiae TaxID=13131 RepID=A0AAV0WNR7_9HEMI|nr:unnamed protein product [Macrosiphum euphorbiae]
MISWERCKNVTVVCCMNAVGLFILPMFIYPRARVSQLLGRGGPAGSLYECSKNGWITTELFFKWMEHFAKVVKPTTLDPVMLIFDNHTSHISIEIYNFCRLNGICIATLQPHTSHKLQPLDLTFFGPLKTTFNRECGLFLKAHPHEKITMYDLASLFNKSYTKVATMDKGLSGFNSAGIFPLNTDKFTADDFAPAQELREVEKEFTFEYLENELDISENQLCTWQGNENEQENFSLERELQAKEEDFNFRSLQDGSTSIHDTKGIVQINDLPSTSTGIYHTSIEQLCPIPKVNATSTKRSKSRKRKPIVLTDTPMKLELEQAKEKRETAKE